MTKDNEDALRCAQSLTLCVGEGLGDEAAAHLRRLVRENEFLSRALANRNSEVIHAAQQLNAKDALLRQAVEALDFAHDALMDAIRVAPLTHQPPRAGAAMQDCAANSDAIRQHLEGRE